MYLEKEIDLDQAINFIEEKIAELTSEINELDLETNEESMEPNRNNEINSYIEFIREQYENVLNCLFSIELVRWNLWANI